MAPQIVQQPASKAVSKPDLSAGSESSPNSSERVAEVPSASRSPRPQMLPSTNSSPADNLEKQHQHKSSRKRPLPPAYQRNGRPSKRRIAAANSCRTRPAIPTNSPSPKRSCNLSCRGACSWKGRKNATQLLQATPLPQPQKPLIKKSTASSKTPAAKEVEVIGPLFKIGNLATELQLNILKNLDYKTLLNISATCRHFRALFLDHDKQMYKLALVAYEEEDVAWKTNLSGEATFAPCYGCLKTLSRCHFSSHDWHASSTSTGARAFRRKCGTCMFSGQLTGPSRVIVDGRGWLFCARCRQLTHLVQFNLCGLWDHTRDGKVWTLRDNPLPPEHSLCKECRP